MTNIESEEFQTYCPKLQRNVCFDYYKLLEISQDASNEEIKKAYHQLARRYHPDTCTETDKEKAKEKFKIIGTAYKHLINPVSRQSYNSFLLGLTMKQNIKQKDNFLQQNQRSSELSNLLYNRTIPNPQTQNMFQNWSYHQGLQPQQNYPTNQPTFQNQSYSNEPGFMDPEQYQSRLFQDYPQPVYTQPSQVFSNQRESFQSNNYEDQIRFAYNNWFFQNRQPQQQQQYKQQQQSQQSHMIPENSFNQYSFLRNCTIPQTKEEVEGTDSFFEKFRSVFQKQNQENLIAASDQSSSSLNREFNKTCRIYSPSGGDAQNESGDQTDSKKEIEPNKKSTFKKVLLTKHSILKQYKNSYDNRIIDKIKRKKAIFALISTKTQL